MATWTYYYKGIDRDGGYLFNKSQQDLADLCMGHVDDASAFALTISTNSGAKLILGPTKKGGLTVLHQGFTTSIHLGGLTNHICKREFEQVPLQVAKPNCCSHQNSQQATP